MSEPAPLAFEQEVPLFNVMASLPSSTTAEEVRRKAVEQLGLPSEKAQALVQALSQGLPMRIAAKVPKEKADQAVRDFSGIGLVMEIVPALSLNAVAAAQDDGSSECLACEEKVVLPANRQCPNCGVFVDKIDPEHLMRLRLMRKERLNAKYRLAKDASDAEKENRENLERAMREAIRKEIEEEMGIREKKDGLLATFSGKAGKARGAIFLVLIVGATGVGWMSGRVDAPPGPPPKAATQAKVEADVDRMIASVEAGHAPEGAGGVDLLDDESLMPKGGGKLTPAQAAEAVAKLTGKGPGEASGSAPGAAAAGAPGAAGAAEGGLDPANRATLTAELAVRLAQWGQERRGREVATSLLTRREVNADTVLEQLARRSEAEVRAWSVSGFASGGARKEIERLRTDIGALRSGVDRSIAYAHAAVAFAQHRSVTGNSASAFMLLAGESLKGIAAKDMQPLALDELRISAAEIALADLTAYAKEGRWKSAQAAYDRLHTLVSAAATPEVGGTLSGIDYRARLALGQAKEAQASLEAGVERVTKAAGAVAKSRALKNLAVAAGPSAQARLREAVGPVASVVDGAKAADRAVALGELAVAHAALGEDAKSTAMRVQLGELLGAATPQGKEAVAEARVRSDLAAAGVKHGESSYLALELVLQRLRSELL